MGRASTLLQLRKICTFYCIEMGTFEAKNNLNQCFLKFSLHCPIELPGVKKNLKPFDFIQSFFEANGAIPIFSTFSDFSIALCRNNQKSLFFIAFILGHDQLSIFNLSLASILVGSKKNPGVIGSRMGIVGQLGRGYMVKMGRRGQWQPKEQC